jgi:plasmid stabilization system protein ParE
MTLAVKWTSYFLADFAWQFEWYAEQGSEEVAYRFKEILEATIQQLARQPEIGRIRRFRNLRLDGLRSFRVAPPFRSLLIFYRVRSGTETLDLVRLIHGGRDLPRRLTQAPRMDSP